MPLSVKDAFDEKRPLPRAAIETLAWIDSKDALINDLEGELREATRLIRNLTDPAPGDWQKALREGRLFYEKRLG